MKIDKQKIAKALIEFGEKLRKSDFKKEKYFTSNLEADKLIWNNSLAYLFSVILDQSMKAEKGLGNSLFIKTKIGTLGCEKNSEYV